MEAGGTPFWLRVGEQPVAAVLHSPPSPAHSTGVLVLPPFGWEEIASYRALRRLADDLAIAGYPVLRLDWPGTGDSAGTGIEHDLFESWKRTAAVGAAWLKSQRGMTRVAAVGLSIGGLVAVTAAADGAPIDDLVLWGSPARGRIATRKLKATAGLLTSAGVEVDTAGTSWVYGSPLSQDLQEALSSVDVSQLDLNRNGLRVLVLGSDSEDLQQALVAAGASVEHATAPGLAELVEHPQHSRLSPAVVNDVARWIGQRSLPSQRVPDVDLPGSVLLSDLGLRERFLDLPTPYGLLRAVVTEPVGQPRAPLTVVLPNSGATRRTGPNRMWVDAARRWGQQGVTTVRLDLSLMGNGGGHRPSPELDADYYAAELIDEVRAALDGLVTVGLPARFVLAGLCSGAYWAWQVAPTDDRVVGAVVINPKAMHYSPVLHAGQASQDLKKLVTRTTWTKALRHGLSTKHGVDVLRAVTVRATQRNEFKQARERAHGALQASVARIIASRTRVAVMWTPEEDLLRTFLVDGRVKQLCRPPLLTVHLLEGPGNNHTLAPRSLRAQADAVLDEVVYELAGCLTPSGGS